MSGTRNYIEVSDIRASGYPFSAAQEEAAGVLIGQACARLRIAVRGEGYDLEALLADEKTGADLLLGVQSLVVQAVCRALDSGTNTGAGAVSQGSQTLGSYTVQQTYLNPGQNLYFLRSELRDLGLRRGQVFGALELWASDENAECGMRNAE